MSIFSQVKTVKHRKNNFNLTHDNMVACEMGQIVPCYLQENILPNSHLKIGTVTLMRLQALLAPLQHNVNAYIHFWWIPARLVDSHFTDFISGTMMRNEETYNPPYFTYATMKAYLDGGQFDVTITDLVKNGTLLDMLGFPIPQPKASGVALTWSSFTSKMSIKRLQYYLLPIYYKYINENISYSDTDLLDLIRLFCNLDRANELQGDVSTDVVDLLVKLYRLNSSMCLPHAWQKDYFTSALPFVQLGEDISLPLGGEADVEIYGGQHLSLGTDPSSETIDPITIKTTMSSPATDEHGSLVYNSEDNLQGAQIAPGSGLSAYGLVTELSGKTTTPLQGTAYLEEATAITINELRLANALQSLKESFARFGTRFNEYLEGFWGQHPDDKTLQMPLWLGGGKIPMNISDIEQKSATANDSVTGSSTPLGTLAGKGMGFGSFKSVNCHFVEQGCVIGLLFLQPKSMYGNQGLNRFITKLDNLYDYLNPKMEHLGEQAVLNQEIYYGDDNQNGGTFGYQSRFAEYKFMPNEVHGQFMDVLNFWHMARIFQSRPTLSPEFIYTQLADTKRPFAVQSIEDEDGNKIDISSVLCWLHFDVQYTARMSRFGTPMLLN